ncbi:MAG: uracil-DNA glycosylase family protein [Pseudomonadota bacterium]
MAADALDLIADIRQYLTYCRDMGIDSIDLKPETREKMIRWTTQPEDLHDIPRNIPGPGRPGNGWFLAQGNPSAHLVFVCGTGSTVQDGEVSLYATSAGDLFKNILKAMNLTPDDILLLSFRYPGRDQGRAWTQVIRRRIQRVKPICICTLGEAAAQVLLETNTPVSGLRGRFHEWQGIPVMATLHPFDLINDPLMKRDLWEDVKQIMGRLEKAGQ